MPIRIFLVTLRNFGQIQFIAKSSSTYTKKSVCATNSRPFGEVGGKSHLQLSLQTHFLKLKIKMLLQKLVLKT